MTVTSELTSYEAAQAAVEQLHAKHQSWVAKRAGLVQTITDLEANAGQAALDGASTGKLADQLSRLRTELTITDQALAALAEQQRQAEGGAKQARLEETRQRAAQLRDQAAQVRAEAESHLAALERIEGQRPEFGRHARSQRLEEEADRYENAAEYQLFQLEHPR